MKIYLGNILYTYDTDEIRELLRPFGEAVEIYIPIDPDTQRSRGFAFATMEDAAARRAVEALNGRQCGGRILRVNEAHPKASREERPRYVEPRRHPWSEHLPARGTREARR